MSKHMNPTELRRENRKFNRTQMAVAVSLVVSAALTSHFAYAGAGWADNTDKSGAPFKQPTFYANSPSGVQLKHGPADAANSTSDTGLALRKFVDPLALVIVPNATAPSDLTQATAYGDNTGYLKANNTGTLGRRIPVAIADTKKYSDADYYEIAVVEFHDHLHSDLPAAKGGTQLRGYVQIWNADLQKNAGVPQGVQLFYPDGVTPILDNKGQKVYAVGDGPHYLGPVINTQSKRPVRLKFNNYLPVGHFDPVTKTRGGDSFVPTDITAAGAGIGPNGAKNPANPTPADLYTQNRALIHLHGGDTPWISDGEPHSWITPWNEKTQYPHGDTMQNVPDMEDPGLGSQTYYFPNQQSARMEWYHDHSVGATRLNVTAGEVSAYMIHDATELDLQNRNVIPKDEIPLVFEDKTFVPADIARQDSKWNTDAWGNYGDFWYPHVYESNQNPNSQDGTNPAGRWDYGPWFWPVFPAPLALPDGTFDASTGMSHASGVQEAFSDTPVINGVAYPNLKVEPKAYRFRLLNGSTQRYLNLGLYVAEPVSIGVTAGGTGYAATTTASVKADANGVVPLTTVTVNPVDGSITDIKVTAPVGVSLKYTATPTVTLAGTGTGAGATFLVSINTEVPMVQASVPNGVMNTLNDVGNTVDANGKVVYYSANTYDGRPGGLPDPAAAGPDIIQIGTEGGFLAQPNVIQSTPVSYQQLRRIVTVLNVLDHGLYVGPAERADFVVDFSQYQGKTLIVYNDAPAPNPGFDARVDYYTGNPDMTDSGGAPSTLPGYGPNTRTIMRIEVANTTPATPYNVTALNTELPAAFAKSQDVPIVPQSWQNAAYKTSYQDNLARIFAGTTQQPNFEFDAGPIANGAVSSIALDSAGTGYTIAPIVQFIGGAGFDALGNPKAPANPAKATAILDAAGGRVAYIRLDSAGSGYTSTPIVNVVNAANDYGIGAAGTAVMNKSKQSIHIENKGIQELFDANYGRMNATFRSELPFTSVLTQTTVPVGYIDPPTEAVSDGATQVWKVTHNGVDTHPVHFHMFNVQVINRVAWDGTVVALDPAEYGWKETVKMNPLEDIYVAVKPKPMVAPFGVPQSIRRFDPTQPLGATAGFSNVDPTTGLATVTTNDLHNYDWEYVWHCHILGHEENDFMRTISYNFNTVKPDYVPFTVSGNTVSWTDPTPAAALTTPGNKKNEIGFIIQRSNVKPAVWANLPQAMPQSAAQTTANPAGVLDPKIGTVVAANTVKWTDPVPATANTSYRVIAFNSAGYSPADSRGTAVGVSGGSSNTAPATINTFTAALGNNWNAGQDGYPVTLNWTTPSRPSSYTLVRSGGIDAAGVALPDVQINVSSTATTAIDYAPQISTLTYRLAEFNNGNPTPSATAQTVVSTPFAPAPNMSAPVVAHGQDYPNVNVSWTAPQLNGAASPYVTSYRVVRTDASGAAVAFQTQQFINPLSGAITAPDTNLVDTSAVAGAKYTYTVTAINGTNAGATSAGTVFNDVISLDSLNATVLANSINLAWSGAPANVPVTAVSITRVPAFTTGTNPLVLPAVGNSVPLTWTDTSVALGTSYTYNVAWIANGATQPASTVGPLNIPYPATGKVAIQSATANGGGKVSLAWTETPATAPVTNFVVQRCQMILGIVCGQLSVVSVLPGTARTYTDSTGLTVGRGYKYTITGVNGTVNATTGAIGTGSSTSAATTAAITVK